MEVPSHCRSLLNYL